MEPVWVTGSIKSMGEFPVARGSCSTASSKTAPYSLSPVGSHYWVSIGEARLFSLPSLALWWEKLGLWRIQRLRPEGGGIMLYTIQSLLRHCCGSPSLNWGGLAFSRLENFWRDKDASICQSLQMRMGGESERMCVQYVWRLCVKRAKLNYNLTFLSWGGVFAEGATHSACLCSWKQLRWSLSSDV